MVKAQAQACGSIDWQFKQILAETSPNSGRRWLTAKKLKE